MVKKESTSSFEEVFHLLQAKYDKQIIYLHAKNETAGSLKAYIEIEQHKLQNAKHSDLDINMDKIRRLKDRFMQLHKELKEDLLQAKLLLQELTHGRHSLSIPASKHEYHLVQKIEEFIRDTDVVYAQMNDRVSHIGKALMTFKSLFESKSRLLQYLSSTLKYVKQLQVPLFDNNA